MSALSQEQEERWSADKTWEWYNQHNWMVGCDFIPSNAINQLEMWQAETFDPATIDKELSIAESIGFNTIRVYLHDLAYQQDPEGFKNRIDQFLQLTDKHGIKPLFVFFDDCWRAKFETGVQPEPIPGRHNSGWCQSPGRKMAYNPKKWDRLEVYVKDILTTYKDDPRILLWDLYNEPGNSVKFGRSLPLLKAVFKWASTIDTKQPVTAGVWARYPRLRKFQLANSDVITFHNYKNAERLEKEIKELKALGRPIICTEWMARTLDSRVETCLPVFERENVGCINWGLVAGKTNTIYPWLNAKGSKEPELWFHDLFRADGTPYRQSEIDLFKQLIAKHRTGK